MDGSAGRNPGHHVSGSFPCGDSICGLGILLSHGPAGRASTYLYLTPVLAIGIAWLWLGKIPKPLSLLGGMIALGGVILVQCSGAFKGRERSGTE